jgi:molybdate transport system permease protein
LTFNPDELAAIWTSLIVATRAVVFALPLAVAVAWVLARGRFFGRTALDLLVHTPMVLPPVLVGYGLLLLFGVQGPVGGWLLRAFHVRLVFTSTGASLASAVMAFPLMVRSARLSLEGIDPAIETAARSLGAGVLDRMATIILPLAAPGVVSAAIVGLAACLGEFGAVITFAANVPGQTQTLPLAIYSALQSPNGDATAFKLAGVSFTLAVLALAASEVVARRVRLDGRA